MSRHTGEPITMPTAVDPGRRRRHLALALVALAVLTFDAACGSGASSSGGGGPSRSVYVAAQHAGEIDRFDAATLDRTATWTIGGDPHILAWDAAQKLLWVSSPKAGTLRAVDPVTGQVVTTLTIAAPDGLAFVPGSGTLLVTSGIVPGRLALVNTVARTVVAYVQVGTAPHAIAVSADGSRAFVTDQYSNDVAVVDVASRKLVSTIPLDGTPYFAALRGTTLFVSRAGNGKVSVVDTNSGKTTHEFQLPAGVSQLALADDGRKLCVAVRGLAFFSGFPNGNVGSTVSVIDLGTGASLDIKVPAGPDAVLLDGNSLLTTGLGQGTVSRVDLASGSVTTRTTGAFPTSVAITGG
jgi:YVTN family beta-propeller protein